jgi:proline iminopeptidase
MKRVYLLALIAAISSLLSGCDNELYVNEEGNLVPKTVEEDLSLPSIQVNGTTLHAEAFGDPADPMVVYLHGGPGSDYRNSLIMRQFTDHGYYVVFYDQRGAGLSKRHPVDSYTLDQVFDDLAGVIAHFRTSPGQKVFLFGHSWGAMLAAGYINKYPHAIAGAILAEPGGFTWDDIMKHASSIRELKLLDENVNDVLYVDQFLTGRENYHAILDYKRALASSSTYAPGNPEGIEGPSPIWRHGAVVYDAYRKLGEREGLDLTTNLRQYEQKVIFLYSENNKGFDKESRERSAGYFNDAEIFEIPDTGHEMIYFKWDTVKPIALNYLNSLK